MSKIDEKIKKLRDTIAEKRAKVRKARRTRTTSETENESTKG